jgi:hypothetical protein
MIEWRDAECRPMMHRSAASPPVHSDSAIVGPVRPNVGCCLVRWLPKTLSETR